MSTLEKAIRIATEVHEGQLDKGGRPYILHCLRIMLAMPTTETQIVAVLHDVLEDSSNSNGLVYKLSWEGFSETVIDALKALTRRKGESYEDYIKRLAPNSLARTVKLSDLQDNLNLSRILKNRKLTAKDHERSEKYFKAKLYLNAFPECGNEYPQSISRENF